VSGARRRAANAYGLRAETIADLWLRAHFYRILARNYRVRGGEIDIVAQRGSTIVFVEVKARGTIGEALAALTPQKQRRVACAANRWVATHPWALQRTLRADAILIAPGRWPHWIVSAFEIAPL
jgi:putative endonuclease